jgi:alkylated DNA nucleotide flippase Atl1
MDKPPATDAVFAYLKRCAREMRTVTYGELGAAVGLPSTGVGRQLGYIRDHVCRPRGLPWLNALAVNAATRRPGERFLPEGFTMNGQEELFWRGMVLQVYAFNWRPIRCEGAAGE